MQLLPCSPPPLKELESMPGRRMLWAPSTFLSSRAAGLLSVRRSRASCQNHSNPEDRRTLSGMFQGLQ